MRTCSQMIYGARIAGYQCSRQIADVLKHPFYSCEFGQSDGLVLKVAKGIFMGIPMVPALGFRALANFINPHDYCHTKGDAEAIDVTDSISVLSANILGFHANQAADENRPFWQERFESICKVIEDADADVVCLQEVHCGSWLENKLIEHFKGKYSDFYGDIAPNTLMFGSGLFVMHRIKDVTLDVQTFKAKAGADSMFVNKAIATLVGDNFTISTTHLQSPSDPGNEEYRDVRWAQTAQMIDHALSFRKEINIGCGDMNEHRDDIDSYETSKLNPKNGYVIDGFNNDDERMRYTQADLDENGEIESQGPMDAIFVIRPSQHANVPCTISTIPLTNYDQPTSPSDHVFMKGQIKILKA